MVTDMIHHFHHRRTETPTHGNAWHACTAGVGTVTIVDGATTSERDLGNNFFLTRASLGKPRASETAKLLGELNDEVQAIVAVERHIGDVLTAKPDFLRQFTLVIATQMVEPQLLPVARDTWARGIPLLVVRSYGLLGYMRIQLREHIVVEGIVARHGTALHGAGCCGCA